MEQQDRETVDAFLETEGLEGPLSLQEVDRRAEISLHNDLTIIRGRLIEELRWNPNLHPETRQVMLREAVLAERIAEVSLTSAYEASTNQYRKEEHE